MRLRMVFRDCSSGNLLTVYELPDYQPIAFGDRVKVSPGQLIFADEDRLSLYPTGYIPDYLPPIASAKIDAWNKAWENWFQMYTSSTDPELWVEQSPPDILEISENQLGLNL